MITRPVKVMLLASALFAVALGQPTNADAQVARAITLMKIALGEATQVELTLKEAFSKDDFEDVEEHGAEIVDLMKEIRRLTVELPDADGEVIRLLVDRAQHAAHELEEAGKVDDHNSAHHAFETMSNELSALRRRLERL